MVLRRGRGGGRKPKPSTIVTRLRDVGKTEEATIFKMPPAPSHLSAIAKREWRRIGRQLLEAGLLGRLDLTALAMYCDAYGRWLEARGILQGPVGYCLNCDAKRRPRDNETPCVPPRHIAHPYGLLTRTRVGTVVPSPYLKIANEAMDQMRRLLGEFGMTPASRSRIPRDVPELPGQPAKAETPSDVQKQDPRMALQEALKVVQEHVDNPKKKPRGIKAKN